MNVNIFYYIFSQTSIFLTLTIVKTQCNKRGGSKENQKGENINHSEIF
jgi:hypothetical protein